MEEVETHIKTGLVLHRAPENSLKQERHPKSSKQVIKKKITSLRNPKPSIPQNQKTDSRLHASTRTQTWQPRISHKHEVHKIEHVHQSFPVEFDKRNSETQHKSRHAIHPSNLHPSSGI